MSKYREPWVNYQGRIRDRNGNIVTKTIDDCNGYGFDEDVARAERITKLVNLFAGVDDKTIERLSNTEDPKIALLWSVLRNPGEETPFAMLIDEIQTTPEYQAQLGNYRTWRELYECLLSTLNMIDNLAQRPEFRIETAWHVKTAWLVKTEIRELRHLISKVVAPIRSFNVKVQVKEVEEKTINVPCYRCTLPWFQPTTEETMYHFGCNVCNGKGFK